MSATKFKPEYELIVGRNAKINNFIIPGTLVSPAKLEQGVNGVGADGIRYSTSPDGTTLKSGDYLDYNTIPAQAFSIKNLQVSASIPENLEEGSKATFQVINLPDNIVQFLRVDDSVCFRAAYTSELGQGEDLPDVYVGQIQKIRSTFEGVDRVTTIDCGAGQTIKKNSRISFSWPPGTTRERVIRDMLNSLKNQGLPMASFLMPSPDSKAYSILKSPYLSGYSIKGNTLDELHKVLAACQMKGSISKGRLFVQPFLIGIHSFENTSADLLFKVTKASVKGQPQPNDGDDSAMPSAANGKTKFQSLSIVLYFDGRIGLDSVIEMDESFEEFTGQYRILSLRHTYDHRGGTYETELDLVGAVNE